MKRSQEEIVARINERKDHDQFGFEVNEYARWLDKEHARPFLKPGADWELETKYPREVMIDYMPFAWEKANGCRGISAWRSLAHYTAWLWLDGDDELWPALEHYEFYGKDELREICAYLGLDADQWDDGVRVNSEGEL